MYRSETINSDGAVAYRRELDGMDEVISVAKSISSTGDTGYRGCASITGTHSFTHTHSLDEAIDLAEHGWPEGRERILERMSEVPIEDVMVNMGNKMDFDLLVYGDEPDIDRYLADDPENMMEPRIDTTHIGRVVKLLVNSSQHAFVDPHQIERRGVVVGTALELLTVAGYGTDVEMVEKSSGRFGKMTVEYRIPVIGAGGYPNMDTLAFASIHPSFLRRLIFSLNESEPEHIREAMGYHSGGGYGMPEYITLDEGERAVVVDKDDYLSGADEDIALDALQLATRLIDTASAQTQL